MGRGVGWSEEAWAKLGHQMCAGLGPLAIARANGWSVSSVKKAMVRIRANLPRHSHPGKQPTLSVEQQQEVIKFSENNPTMSLHQVQSGMAATSGIEGVTYAKVQKVLSRGSTAVKPTIVQALTPKHQELRYKWAKWMLIRVLRGMRVRLKSKLAPAAPLKLKGLVFSDECYFRADQAKVNGQNNKVRIPKGLTKKAAVKIEKYAKVLKREKPKRGGGGGVMVGALWSCKVGLSPIWAFEAGIKIDSEVYQKQVSTPYWPWMVGVGHPLAPPTCFQEDGAPAHSSKSTKEFFAKHAGGMERLNWPPNSPDLNVLDWYIWGACKAKVAGKQVDDPISVLCAVHEAAAELRAKDNISAVSEAFVRRLRACIRADGGHFEHLL